MKIHHEFTSPFPGDTRRLVVDVATEKSKHVYIKRFDGLAFPSDDFRATNGYRLAVPNEEFNKSYMVEVLKEDGLSPEILKGARVGAEIVIEINPGFSVGMEDVWRKRQKMYVAVGGRKTTIDGKRISR